MIHKVSKKMINKIFLSILFLFTWFSVYCCTSFVVGKDASTDGSSLMSYSADSYLMYGSLYHSPAASYADSAMLSVHDWETGKYLGKVKQVPKTYSVVGNMNDQQVSIGESTFGGRPELVDSTGILDYGSLIYIALQRASSAREAIKVMTDLVSEYGYCSSGESFSIADPTEIWIMEMIGKGANNRGAVWVAQRIPDDAVSAHANQARITIFPLEDTSNCLYSSDVIAFAREKGYFNGRNVDFSFSDIYNPLDYSALRFCEARVWSFFRKVDPAMGKYLGYIKGDSLVRMPLWVRPKVKISTQNLKDYMRDEYQGSDFDMSKGLAAGAFGSKLRNSPLTFKLDSLEYGHDRPVATQQTAFSLVAQMRSWLPNYIGGVLWFGVDDAACSLYVPLYCGIDSIPFCYSFKNGNLVKYSASSAFWIFNGVSNFAYSKYNSMLPDIRKVQAHWEKDFTALVPAVDKLAIDMSENEARAYLTKFSIEQAEKSTDAWKKLGEYLLVKYLDGNVKKEHNGQFIKNEFGIPPSIIRVGYPEEYLRKMVKEEPSMRMKTALELKNRK